MNNSNQHNAANILIVDDTPPNLKLLSDMLKKEGYRVRPHPVADWRYRLLRRNLLT